MTRTGLRLTWDLRARPQVCCCMAGNPGDDGNKSNACIATVRCLCCMSRDWLLEGRCQPAGLL